jgi:hypothetical protein
MPCCWWKTILPSAAISVCLPSVYQPLRPARSSVPRIMQTVRAAIVLDMLLGDELAADAGAAARK